jgi:hypothetical protein
MPEDSGHGKPKSVGHYRSDFGQSQRNAVIGYCQLYFNALSNLSVFKGAVFLSRDK